MTNSPVTAWPRARDHSFPTTTTIAGTHTLGQLLWTLGFYGEHPPMAWASPGGH